MGRLLKRSPSTISRELARHSDGKSGYIASQAGTQAGRLRAKPRKALKLVTGNFLFEIVVSYLKKNWSQICLFTPKNNWMLSQGA
ncbi:MAG: hypothetical protein H0X02_12415 [Nitrosomonas sp.]|nr:hypothetical protein [Nitrosomonas sp.]